SRLPPRSCSWGPGSWGSLRSSGWARPDRSAESGPAHEAAAPLVEAEGPVDGSADANAARYADGAAPSHRGGAPQRVPSAPVNAVEALGDGPRGRGAPGPAGEVTERGPAAPATHEGDAV